MCLYVYIHIIIILYTISPRIYLISKRQMGSVKSPKSLRYQKPERTHEIFSEHELGEIWNCRRQFSFSTILVLYRNFAYSYDNGNHMITRICILPVFTTIHDDQTQDLVAPSFIRRKLYIPEDNRSVRDFFG